MKAYRQDFDTTASLIFGGDTPDLSRMSLGDITTDTMRTMFAQYAQSHELASIQRCWSTWDVLRPFRFTSELIAANPMPLVGRPKLTNALPKATCAGLEGRPGAGPSSAAPQSLPLSSAAPPTRGGRRGQGLRSHNSPGQRTAA